MASDDAPVTPRRGGLRRAGLGIADQGLYSAGNFALTILVARSVSTPAFGAYSIIVLTYLVAVAVIRGLTAETFVVRFSAPARTDAERAAWRTGAGNAGGTALVAGVVSALGMLVIGLVAGVDDPDGLGAAAVAFAVCLPGLALQDFWRFAALARSRPAVALVNDAVVTVLQVAGASVVIASGHPSVVAFVLVWGLSATLGAVIGAVQLRVAPRVLGVLAWWRPHRDLAGRYALDDFATQGSQQGSQYVVGAIGGLAQAGALRAAQTVFGPPSILNLGVQTAVTPELVRLLARSPARMRRAATLLGLGLAVVAAVWGAVALVVPDSVGQALFGVTWAQARPLLLFLAIAQVFNSVRIAPQASLRALADGRRTLQGRWLSIGIGLPVTVAGAATGDARYVALGLAVVNPIVAAAYWVLARRSFAEHVARRDRETAAAEPAAD